MARRYTRDAHGRFASTGGKAGRKKLNARGNPKLRKIGRDWFASGARRGGPAEKLFKHLAERGTVKIMSGRKVTRPKRTPVTAAAAARIKDPVKRYNVINTAIRKGTYRSKTPMIDRTKAFAAASRRRK